MYGNVSAPAFNDLDGDGDTDMVSGEENGRFWFYSNQGGGTYTEYSASHTNNPFREINISDYSNPIFVDVDGDGDLDIVTGHQDGSFSYLIRFGETFLFVNP